MVYTVENENYVLKIEQDDVLVETPREWDNLGKMICWHNRYNLGDEHNYDDIIEWQDDILNDLGYDDEEIEDMSQEQVNRIIKNNVLTLPLYLYDHSGITMNTTRFSCNWDSGQVGIIYVTHDDIINEYGKLDLETARKVLVGEVEVYNQYLTGDVWGYIIENKDGDVIDSCWGFYGLNVNENGMKDYLGVEFGDLLNKLECVI